MSDRFYRLLNGSFRLFNRFLFYNNGLFRLHRLFYNHRFFRHNGLFRLLWLLLWQLFILKRNNHGTERQHLVSLEKLPCPSAVKRKKGMLFLCRRQILVPENLKNGCLVFTEVRILYCCGEFFPVYPAGGNGDLIWRITQIVYYIILHVLRPGKREFLICRCTTIR